MDKKEYKIVIESEENNVGFQMFINNGVTGWDIKLWNQYTDEDKHKFKQLAQSFVDLLTKFGVK